MVMRSFVNFSYDTYDASRLLVNLSSYFCSKSVIYVMLGALMYSYWSLWYWFISTDWNVLMSSWPLLLALANDYERRLCTSKENRPPFYTPISDVSRTIDWIQSSHSSSVSAFKSNLISSVMILNFLRLVGCLMTRTPLAPSVESTGRWLKSMIVLTDLPFLPYLSIGPIPVVSSFLSR